MRKLQNLIGELENLENELLGIESKEASSTKQLEELAAQAEPDDTKLVEALTALKTRISLFPNAKRRRLDRIAAIQSELAAEYRLECKFLTANAIDARKAMVAKFAAGLRPLCASQAEAEALAGKASGLAPFDEIIRILQSFHGMTGRADDTTPMDAARGILATAEHLAKLTGQPIA